MLDFNLTINGVDFKPFIRWDSYSTRKIPVYSQTVTTIDGVEHKTLIRNRGELSFSLNPQNATNTLALASALLTQPCTVNYFSLQTQQYEGAIMALDGQSAEYLVRCKFQGEKWNKFDSITLTEL